MSLQPGSSWGQAAAPGWSTAAAAMPTRLIPHSGEALPVIGCGTYRGFDQAPGSAAYRALPDVLQALFEAGGRVLDTSPMYGRAEQTLGEVLARVPAPGGAFLASKVWTRGREAGLQQMQRTLQLLHCDCIDLMQVHNLVDWQTHLGTLRDWQARGRVRHIGVSHYTAGAYDQLLHVLRYEPLDFVQLNYSLEEREAELEVLPLAIQRGVAVLVNMPFGGGRLLRALRQQPLPGWAADIGVSSWNQLLLKFVLSHPAVTCVIPGTGNPAHMADNARTALSPHPPSNFWPARLHALGFRGPHKEHGAGH